MQKTCCENNTTCPKCGQPFFCACLSLSTSNCWCLGLPSLKTVYEDGKKCLCPTCFNEIAKSKNG